MTGATPETTPAAGAIGAGRWLFAQECRFVAGAPTMAALPPAGLPEVAFAGRSNVGKSSLVNALTGRRTLARTSQTPGRTRQLNFFDLGGRLMLVDLPGYGYAKAPKHEIADWTRLVRDYLRGRPTLRRLLLLIDSRHGPKPSDLEVMALLDEAAVAWQAVLTKADQPGARALAGTGRATAAELARHPAALQTFAVTSAGAGTGIAGLRATLAAIAGVTEARPSSPALPRGGRSG